MEMSYTETFLLSLITYHLKRDRKRPIACIKAISISCILTAQIYESSIALSQKVSATMIFLPTLKFI